MTVVTFAMLAGVMVGGLCQLLGLEDSCQPGAYGTHAGFQAHRWGTDPDHGELGPVLRPDKVKLALIPSPEFPIWFVCRCSLLAQSLPRRSLLPFGAPHAVRGRI